MLGMHVASPHALADRSETGFDDADCGAMPLSVCRPALSLVPLSGSRRLAQAKGSASWW